jgi:tRNA G18 (ribose-2'-O)-methylase SpoU
MRALYVIAHNIRSTHNIGALLRSAEGLGVKTVFLTGYSPYPLKKPDTRLPHIAQKLHSQISKTALGAETLQAWEYQEDVTTLIKKLSAQDITVIALEQTPTAIKLNDFQPTGAIALLIGEEVKGINQVLLKQVEQHVFIPMFGKKESFNVSVAAAMALYHLRFDC